MKTTKAYQESYAPNETGVFRANRERTLVDRVVQWTNYAKKWRKLIAVVLLIGASLGTYEVATFDPNYTTHLLAKTNYLSASEVRIIVEGIENRIKKNDLEGVSSILNIDIDVAATMKGLRCEFTPKKSEHIFKLNMTATSKDRLEPIQAGIFSYLENLDYVKNIVDAENELATARLTNLNRGYAKLDSMEANVLKSIGVRKSEIEVNPKPFNDAVIGYAQIVNQKLAISESKVEVRKDLRRSSNFEVIQGFNQFIVKDDKNPFKIFFFPFGIMLVIGILLIWLLELREEVLHKTLFKKV